MPAPSRSAVSADVLSWSVTQRPEPSRRGSYIDHVKEAVIVTLSIALGAMVVAPLLLLAIMFGGPRRGEPMAYDQSDEQQPEIGLGCPCSIDRFS